MRFILLIFGLIFLNCVNSEKLKIIIMYESLCPDSLKFVNEQLYPTWPEIAPYVDIYFVPFGKSSSSHNGIETEFKCQHGPMECTGNKLQSCALNSLHDPYAQTEFVHCFMNMFNNNNAGKRCAANVGLQWHHLIQCYRNENGNSLQLQAESITKQIKPNFVPTILYNGVFNQEDQDESLINFKSVVYKHLSQLK